MKIEVLNTVDRRILADAQTLARRVRRELKPRRCSVSVAMVSDREMRELNRRFRDRDRTTDVLAFPIEAAEPGKVPMLGEVCVSRERARVQGREHGSGYHGEVRRLMLHGILHLLGLGHRDMEKRYERLLK